MDDLTDPFLSSPSWWDMNASGRSSWVGASVTQANSLLAGSIGTYESDEKSASICMIPSNHIMGNVSAEESNLHGHDGNSSILVDMNMKYGINKDMLPTENQPKHEVQNHIPSACQHAKAQESSFSVKGANESNPSAGSFGSELNASCSVALLHGAVTDACSINSNGSELTAFPQSLGNSHSISSVSTMWPPTYCSVSSLLMGQGNVQGLGLQGVESDAEMLREACFGDGKFLTDQSELNSQSYSFLIGQQIKLVESNGLLPHRQEQHELPNVHLPSFASGPQMSLTRPAGISRQQSAEGNNIKHYSLNTSGTQSQSTPSNAGGCNGVVKPRVRARRGQATDPHSIAERLRREKITERMKNLQELVPNSNKTDKASMLDEIIEYVKFLQLQVKVLSMSRLGAAGAVVPLITDAQSEASGSLHLSSSVGQGLDDPSESQENLAFEQEVVKLMESNVTTAMQFLQNKGLCLMPIALASAISSQKGQSAAIPRDVKEADVTHGMISPSGREGAPGGCNGAVVKQEEATKPVDSMKEMKLKS